MIVWLVFILMFLVVRCCMWWVILSCCCGCIWFLLRCFLVVIRFGGV